MVVRACGGGGLVVTCPDVVPHVLDDDGVFARVGVRFILVGPVPDVLSEVSWYLGLVSHLRSPEAQSVGCEASGCAGHDPFGGEDVSQHGLDLVLGSGLEDEFVPLAVLFGVHVVHAWELPSQLGGC